MNLREPHISREEIQSILFGMKPNSLENYRRALVHKSMLPLIIKAVYNGEQVCSHFVYGKNAASNERLEFLGDAVLDFIVGSYLFTKFPNKSEGFLTRLRIKIVKGSHCVKFSKLIGLDKYVLVNSKNIVNDKILEDAFEAFLGATYLDLGFNYTNEFVIKLIDKFVDLNMLLEDDNYKDILMRYSRSKDIPLPEYQITKKNRTFCAKIILKVSDDEEIYGIGYNSVIKHAEQKAAENILKKLDQNDLLEIKFS